MSATVLHAEEKLIQAALTSLLAERRLADADGNVISLGKASDDLRLAAKDLALAVDQLPAEKWPEGWAA